ncbi:glucan biosynthesis protein [Xylophilus sp. Leaf220]|uniref:glucan biosynthesis protein n=1 Tax=Xylophilus sp. Leaf220 TaxID=1735686 RepID=UPI0006F5287F|nr:glucan biosynthesis protein D [Xylophilus sp. Leaf220]KQM68680.1 glucan biosynthesis protein D [Xylophilus sp. Leaf220]
MKRRRFLGAACAGTALGTGLPAPAAWAAGLKPLGTAQPFDAAWLQQRARALAARPWKAPVGEVPPAIAGLGYDAYQAIRFKDDHALWADLGLPFQIKLFHLGMFFKRRVHIHEVVDGRAQELAYDPAMFDYGRSALDGDALPPDLGFAGFRLATQAAPRQDVVAFLGASYFRAVGGTLQYGLSARGLAVDTALARDEEFPDFTDFYIERPAAGAATVVVHALLDSPSIAGAYRFALTPGEPTAMEVQAALYPRKPIERLGLAPLTSMYQTGENDRRMANDWRPEIHDSDGLWMHTGAGEWIWRPLRNPTALRFNAFSDNNPRGFGLMQRDRNFENYQDDGVFYEKRPSVWVQPTSDWGPGSVDLVEIPTVDETFDNIVAFWNPQQKPLPGQELLLGYRLFWGDEPPVQMPLARCVASRTGLGGILGRERRYYSWRFAVDFAGGNLASLPPGTAVELVVSASRGTLELTSARPLASVAGWRAMFDVVPDDTVEPVALRLFLRAGGQALTETWVYEWVPPPVRERQA